MDESLVTTWNEMYVEHERFVHRLAFDLVRDSHLAEDLVQQTWLAAIERPPRARRSLKGWLATVLRNLATDHFRADRRPTADDDAGVERDASLALADSEEDELIKKQVFESMHELDEIYRVVLGRHYLEGLTLPAVASQLDLPLETVRTRCRRGLQRLRERLDQKHGSRRPWVAALLPLARPPISSSSAPPSPAASGGEGGATTALLGARLWPFAALLVGTGALVFWGLRAIDTGLDPAPVFAAGNELGDGQLARGAPSLTGARVALGSGAVALDDGSPHRLRNGNVRLTLRTLHDVSGEPLPEIRVYFQQETSEVHGDPLVLTSDGDGRIELDDLAPGRWTLRPERGPGHVLDLPAKDESEIQLAIPDGIEVRGRVLDARGEPVPFAEVFSTWPEWIRTFPIGECDAQGAFRVESFDRRSWLCGRGEYGLGWMFGFDTPLHRGLATIEVDLLLADEGRSIEGLVVDSHGRPIQGASVRVMARSLTTALPPRLEQEDVLGCIAPHAEIQASDENGAFQIGGLRDDLESFRVGAWANGYVAGGVRASFDHEGPIIVELEREAVVEGRVKTPQGRPAAYARILAHVRGQAQPLITRADVDGRYRLDRLPAGLLEVTALSDRLGSAGYAERELDLRPGRTTKWNVRLEQRSAIEGQAVDALGQPFAGWIVTLQPESEIESHRVTSRFNDNRLIRRARTDKKGRYAFFGCSSVDHLVKLFNPEDKNGFPRVGRWMVRPDTGKVDLVVDVSGTALSHVRGRLLLETGDAPRAAEVRLYSRLLGRSIRGHVGAGSGRFDVGPLPAGAYSVQAWVPPALPTSLEAIEVAPGQILDLGDVELPEPEPTVGRRPERAGGDRR